LVRKDRPTVERLINDRLAIIEELDIAKEKYLNYLK
jgi:hypothetical protein